MKQRILAFSAHPDDVEFGCGGILVKERKKGSHVGVVYLSKGESGSFGTSMEREKESKNASKVMGVKTYCIEAGGDSHIEYTMANKINIARIIRELKPTMVLAPHPYANQHPDHSTTGKLVRDACRIARYGGLRELKSLPKHAINTLYFYTIVGFPTAYPDIVVDISDVFDRWVKTMKCYKSQLTKKNYLELQISKARYLGLLNDSGYCLGLWVSAPISVDSISKLNNSARSF